MSSVTDVEELFYYYIKGTAGSFTTNLFKTIQVADVGNRIKIGMGFPEHVEVWYKYRTEEGYWEDLCNRMTIIT